MAWPCICKYNLGLLCQHRQNMHMTSKNVQAFYFGKLYRDKEDHGIVAYEESNENEINGI